MGRHLQLLERSTDGRISDQAWAAAQLLDDMEARARKPAQVELRIVALKPGYVIRQMARIIADAAIKRETVCDHDFARAGITEDLARRHFPAALAKARVLEPALEGIENAAA